MRLMTSHFIQPRMQLVLILALWLTFPPAVMGSAIPSPEENTIRLPVSRDTWLSAFKDERDANLGGEKRLKAKGILEFSLVDLEPEDLKGRVVTSATLHLRSRSQIPLRRVTVSTLASDWVEGTSTRYRSQTGSSSFNWAAQNESFWAWPGSDATAVMNGLGNTIWEFADARPPGMEGWQEVVVDPDIVAARVAGLSYGFVVFDDVGTEYQRNGDRVTHQPMINRFFSSSEAGSGRAPYFTIQLGPEDLSPPRTVTGIRSEYQGLPAGEARVSWTTPSDKGAAGTLGFHVRITTKDTFDWDLALPVPRYLIPMAGKHGERVTLHLRDMDLKPGQSVIIGVRAVDATGNVGPVFTSKVALAKEAPDIILPEPPSVPQVEEADQLPSVGGLKVFVIDALDKVDPITGEMIPPHPDEYKLANHHWWAAKRQVRLFAARNETISFQLVATGKTKGLRATVDFDDSVAVTPNPELFVFHYVKAKDGRLLPDPLVPLDPDSPPQIPSDDGRLSRQTHASIIVDIHVPKNTRPGLHKGTLRVTSGEDTLALDIALQVWNFTLPDQLSFIPQMNGYGRVPEKNHELDYYRLAHKHRTCLNILPYGWTGRIADKRAPEWNGKEFGWEAYDQRFAPLLDGSAFADLPRGPIPVEAFYLPLNENWPVTLHDKFLGGYWVEDAFKPGYRVQFVEATRKIAEHIQAQGWDRTMFEFYLNNKVRHKKKSWKSSSAPWNFDEPVNTQDFWALRWYGQAFQEGVRAESKPANLLFRADISRPQYQRDLLDGILDVNVVGGGYRRYLRTVLDRKSKGGETTYTYGSANPVEQSNFQPVGWTLEAWAHGLDGVTPWQTLGKSRSWAGADTNALFYPGDSIGRPGPLPSIRLKAFRRGQQDVEYLVLLVTAEKRSQQQIGEITLRRLLLDGEFLQAQENDAGHIDYQGLDPLTLWQLRTSAGSFLSEKTD